MDDFLDFLFGGGLNAGAGIGLLTGAYNRLGDIGDQAQTRAEQLGETALEQTSFRPYSVTTSGGSGFTANPDGDYRINLGSGDQAMMDQLQSQAMANFRASQGAGSGLASAGNQLINAGLSGIGGGISNPVMPTGGTGMGSARPPVESAMSVSGGFGVPSPTAQTRVGDTKGVLASGISDGGPTMYATGGGRTPSPSMPSSNPYLVGSSNALINQGQRLMGNEPSQTTALSNFGGGMLNYRGPEVAGAGQARSALGQSFDTSSNFQNQLNRYDVAGREQAVFDRMQTAMAPQRERDSLALESRLASQGRLGVATNQYGGTPEQLAQAKAFAEADNSAMLQAMGQAQNEMSNLANIGSQFGSLGNQTFQGLNQATNAAANTGLQGQQLGVNAINMGGNLQNAFTNTGINAIGQGQAGLFNNAQMGQIASNIGLNQFNAGQNALLNSLAMEGAQQDLGIGALNASYLPQAQMLNALAPGMTAAGQAQQGQMYGAGLNNEAIASGIEALLGSAQGQANLMGTVGSGLLSGANNSGGDEGNWLDLFRDWLG